MERAHCASGRLKDPDTAVFEGIVDRIHKLQLDRIRGVRMVEVACAGRHRALLVGLLVCAYALSRGGHVTTG